MVGIILLLFHACKVGDLRNVYHFELKESEKVRVRTESPFTTKSNSISSEPCVSNRFIGISICYVLQYLLV